LTLLDDPAIGTESSSPPHVNLPTQVHVSLLELLLLVLAQPAYLICVVGLLLLLLHLPTGAVQEAEGG
jgi:hypothetical protein